MCIFIGIYILYLNPRNKPNILFFALTVALGIWALGMSMAVCARDMDTALFWRRFSAIGWGSFFSILLHFSLVFTGYDSLLCKKWSCWLLYLPTLAIFLVFTYFPKLNPGQYNLISSRWGWINVAVNNFWDIFHVAHYALYSLTSFYLIGRWGKHSRTPRAKKLSLIIQSSFFLLSSSVRL